MDIASKLINFVAGKAGSFLLDKIKSWYKDKKELPEVKLDNFFREVDENLHINTLSSLLYYARGRRPSKGEDPKVYVNGFASNLESITKEGQALPVALPEDGENIKMYTWPSAKAILALVFAGLKYAKISEDQIAKIIAYKFKTSGVRITYDQETYDKAMRDYLKTVKDGELIARIYDELEYLKKVGIAYQAPK